MTKLKQIADIKTGVPEKSASYGVEVLGVKMKNINHKTATLSLEEVEPITTDARSFQYLKEGDIIIVSKGENNTAVVIKEIDQEMVATNHFFIIGITTHDVKPEYLAWYLNNPARQYLDLYATGTVIRNLRKEVLAEMPIQVPSMQSQEVIINIWNSMQKEQQLFEELQQERKALLNSLINQNIY